MKSISSRLPLLLFLLLTIKRDFGQCPFTTSLTGANLTCNGGDLTVNAANTLAKIVWNKDGAPLGTVTATNSYSQNGITVAGGNGGGAAANQIGAPFGMFIDKAGNMYIVDNSNNRIQKWAPGATSGITVAGGNGQGAAANQFYSPAAVYVDGNGNIYVADQLNYRVQKWASGASSGITVAGGNGSGAGNNQLSGPRGMDMDAAGNLYIADLFNDRIQMWAPGATSGVTVAGGNGTGIGPNQLRNPLDVKLDAAGNIYIADGSNSRVQKWAPGATNGITVAGGSYGSAPDQFSAMACIYVDVNNNVFVADEYNDRVQEWTPGATSGITVAGGNGRGNAMNQLRYPCAASMDAAGNLYVVDLGNSRIQKFLFSSTINNQYNATAPGSYTASVTDANGCTVTTNAVVISQAAATLNSTGGNCLGSATLNVGTTNTLSQIVWKKDGAGVSTVNATNVTTGMSGITVAGGNGGGAGTNQIGYPGSVYVDGMGNVYVTDLFYDRVEKWAPGATSSVIVAGGNGQGPAPNQFWDVDAVFVDGSGNVYLADAGNNRIQKWAPGATSGITVAGGHGQGPAANQLYGPGGLFVDGSGNIYVVDTYNDRIQMWAPGAASGVTVAGGNGEGTGANQFHNPQSIYVDGNGNMYITDWGNYRVQEWAPGATSGVTVAGGNGQGAAANQLRDAYGISVDPQGNIYVVDASNNRVQKWAPGASSGVTVAGGNGAGPAANQLNIPVGLYMDANGNMYITDPYNNRVQKWGQQTTINTTYQPVEAGAYTAFITTNSGCTFTTNDVIIDPLVTPGVSVNASATTICAGVPVTFTATPANGGTTPAYQWQVNGVNAGTNAAVYMDNGSLTNGANVTCIMTSNATCPATPTATSSPVRMVVNPVVTPTVNITATTATVCSGQPVLFTATPLNGGPDPGYTWQVNGAGVSTSGPDFTSNTLKDGDKVGLLLSSNAFCSTSPTATSNVITVSVVKDPGSTVSITGPAAPMCSGTPVSFTATATNGGNAPVYQWQVNGTNAGVNSPYYTDNHPVSGDIITCALKSNNVCPAALSNSIPLTVNASPFVQPGQVFSISQGQDITLTPVVSGNIIRYSWEPATGLSDATIPDPIADPSATTTYKLKVTTSEGCEASGDITVKVFTQLRLPNAFTPNGDGKNDVFYIMGGPAGSIIRDFVIFNRWGQTIFQVHDVAPGDPNYGWKGDYRGALCPPGAYVYMIGMVFGDHTSQVIKGTVMLVR